MSPDQEIGGGEVRHIDEGTSRDTIVKQDVVFLDNLPASDSGEGKIADSSVASQSTPTEQRLRFRNVIIQRHGSRDVLRESLARRSRKPHELAEMEETGPCSYGFWYRIHSVSISYDCAPEEINSYFA